MSIKKPNKLLVLSVLGILSLVSCTQTPSTSEDPTKVDPTTVEPTSVDPTITSEETTQDPTSDSEPTTSEEIKERNDLFISEVLINGLYDGYLEIANVTGQTLNLNDYKIRIYRYGDVDVEVDLSGKIIENGRVIVFQNPSSTGYEGEVINLEKDALTGKNYIEIVKGEDVIDTIGTKGFNLAYIKEGAMVRFEEFFKAYKDYNYLHYFSIRSGIYKYLGNLDVLGTQQEYLEGPKIAEIYKNFDFIDDSNRPEGGFLNVRVSSYGDGDTTFFYELDNSVRYLMINTPEVYHPGKEGSYDEPWAQTAKKFNNTTLRNAKKIMVQSNKGYALHETYGRYLGYVWYSDVSNPKLSDYKLLNYEMVLNGLARVGSKDYTTMWSEDDVYYADYVTYAEKYATSLERGVFGPVGNDPDYDYSNSSYIGN